MGKQWYYVLEKDGADRTLCFVALVIADRTLCFQRIGAFDHYIDPAKRSESSHIGREFRFLNKSLRHIAARSDIVRSGTPDVAYPFPGSLCVYHLLACFCSLFVY